MPHRRAGDVPTEDLLPHPITDSEMTRVLVGLKGHVDALRVDMIDLRREQPVAMAQAMREVLTDPAVVSKMMDIAVTTAQQRAAEKTGRAMFSVARPFLTRWLVIACIVLLVAKAAGIEVAAKVWKLLTGGTP